MSIPELAETPKSIFDYNGVIEYEINKLNDKST